MMHMTWPMFVDVQIDYSTRICSIIVDGGALDSGDILWLVEVEGGGTADRSSLQTGMIYYAPSCVNRS